MAEQWNNGQPGQGSPQPPNPYPYPQQQPQRQPQGYQGPPPQQPQGYQGPPPQQPYPPQQQYGVPQQQYPQAPPQQYPGQNPGQQYPGQQYQGQPYPPQQQPYGQMPPGQMPQGAMPQEQMPQFQDPNQPAPKKKRKHRGWVLFLIILFSPLIGLAYVFYGIYWLLAWLLTPVGMVLHFVFCGLGLIWYSGVKLMASGRSKSRILQPVYPRMPRFWTAKYWVDMNRDVRAVVEGIAGILEIFS